MQRIEDWLARIGLERYAAAFAHSRTLFTSLKHVPLSKSETANGEPSPGAGQLRPIPVLFLVL